MKYYRLMASLPPLPEVPDAPPIGLGAAIELFLSDLDDSDRPLALALLGFLDCRNLEALLQDQPVFDERGVLTREMIRERVDLPEYLLDFIEQYELGSVTDPYPFDALWRAYFGHLLAISERSGRGFLEEWAQFEIGLRDALVLLRAEDLGEKGELRTTGLLAEEGESQLTLLSAFAEAPNPLEAERVLDAARLRKIESLAGIDPFSRDAVLAYLAALLILDRWDLEKGADMTRMLEVFG